MAPKQSATTVDNSLYRKSRNRNKKYKMQKTKRRRKRTASSGRDYSRLIILGVAVLFIFLVHFSIVCIRGKNVLASDAGYFTAVSTDLYSLKGYDLTPKEPAASTLNPQYISSDSSQEQYSFWKNIALTYKTGKNVKKAKKQNVNLFIKCEATSSGKLTGSFFAVKEKKTAKKPIEIITPVTADMMKTPGAYLVTLETNGKYINAVLLIVDTTAPSAAVKDAQIFQGGEISAEQVTSKISDVLETEIVFTHDVDTSELGTQTVEFYLVDGAGNKSKIYTTTINVQADDEKPEITNIGDRIIALGDTVAYKDGVIVKDNSGAKIEVEVDSSAVDPYNEGQYNVIYTATDPAGNTASETVVFTFKEITDEQVKLVVDEKVSSVLNSITKSGDTKYEKASAIFNWVKENIAYSGSSDKEKGWEFGAYEGFTRGSGDCYTFYAISKALLEGAEIPNQDIKKIQKEGQSRHYWSLVDLGTGWYHYDTCPRRDAPEWIFMYTDEQLLNYSKQHDNSHDFDSSLYPRTPTEKFQ